MAADDNLVCHAWATTRRLPGARIVAAEDITLVDSGLPCDTFNFVCGARLGSQPEHRIQDALAFFEVTGHPFSWWHGPSSTPDDLPALLQRAGLQAAERELAMVAQLEEVPPPPPRPATLVIRRVGAIAELEAFAAVSAANWTPPDPHVLAYYRKAGPWLLRAGSGQWLFVGYLDGDPVATAELTIGGGVVGLYNIATRPDARRRGIGSAMTQAVMQAGRDAGFDRAILQAADDGVRLYIRLGFEGFGTITEFKPPARSPD